MLVGQIYRFDCNKWEILAELLDSAWFLTNMMKPIILIYMDNKS